MSAEDNVEWPELGELVVASVSRITPHGAYVTLDEYGKEGFLHVSEISSSWVKNIHNFIHEGEKVVLRVLRVDRQRKHIDLSLRRVTRGERRDRMLLWKRGKKAESLIRSAAQRLGTPMEEVYEKTWTRLEEVFGEAYEGLERAASEGPEVLLEQGLPKELAEVLAEISKEKIKARMVKTKGNLELSCTKPDGVLQIKGALMKAKKVEVPRGAEIRISVVSPPRYRIEVTASDYKDANAIIKKATDAALESIAKAGGQGAFKGG